ncbi:MAG TPA: hypothetical protein PKM40_01975, partial [Bacteroidia bacterium]|nr:hypothetical protein [Bacteroidia bacterium]
MSHSDLHRFHIPVMGLAFTVDTPVKVARYGISSVVSIIEHNMLEVMREFYYKQNGKEFTAITKKEEDYRAKRVTAYLNIINEIVLKQITDLRNESFETGKEINKYFEMLPDTSEAKLLYRKMQARANQVEKEQMQQHLRTLIKSGAIDVNIMTKVDRINYDKNEQPLAQEFSDAHNSLRGFAHSNLNSSIVFSAGLNPRLYSYCEKFDDFFPDESGFVKKKITLKVSDFRSAQVQGRFFAKKGIWISEFRVESGLNCGGHAFATNGLLLGPILEEFKLNKNALYDELFNTCQAALAQKNKPQYKEKPKMKVTVQGGIGTSQENDFLYHHYEVDLTGWGSPFLLVPEATNVDKETLGLLATASKDDYYLSEASPLGVPFNNFRKSSAERQRKERIAKNRPGSACYKKFLAFNTEYGGEPICTASRKYQHLKLQELKQANVEPSQKQIDDLLIKDCLCEGLASPVMLVNNVPVPHNLNAVTICPGPNLAYFSGTFTLQEMINHIYGRVNVLNTL